MTNQSLDTSVPVSGFDDAHAQSPHTREAGKQPLAGEALADMVERARRGEQAALDRLLGEARPRALAVAMKVLRNPVDAEDAVQDALMKAWRYLPRFEGRASFFTWIHRIVMNASLDILRREKVRSEGHDEDDRASRGEREEARVVESATDETPERHLVAVETGRLVREAIAGLSPVHRETLVLREFEERSYEEIAAVVRCPVGTVMSRLHHARRRLADELVHSFADSPEPARQAA